METAQIPQTSDELEFNEAVVKIAPLLETLTELLSHNRVTLKTQKYRIENNHLMIVNQEKQIAQHGALIESSKNQAAAIIAAAEERVKELEKGVQMRIAQANHMEREAKKKYDEADKAVWQKKNKVETLG